MSEGAITTTLEAMEKFGGGFVKSLRFCYTKADPINKGRLLDAFPDYFERYKRIAREQTETKGKQ